MTATQNATSQKFAVEVRKIDDVRPYDRNPRLNDSAVDAVAASLAEFGFRQPIVVDEDGVIIVGHTRWKAARKLGLAKVPVHVATDLSAEQVRAYRIADNKTGELAEWDLEILPIELNELREGGFDMDLLAFDEEELGKLLTSAEGVNEGLTDADAVPEQPDEAITQPGDIWVLGNHRLMCGDSGSVADLDRLLDGATIDLVNMDPPYNVRCEPRSNNAIAAGLSSFPASNAAQETLKRDQGNTAFTAAMQKKGSGKKPNAHDKAPEFRADPGRDVHRNPGSAKATHKKMRPKGLRGRRLQPVGDRDVIHGHEESPIRRSAGHPGRDVQHVHRRRPGLPAAPAVAAATAAFLLHRSRHGPAAQ
jgi:hypothetical protein